MLAKHLFFGAVDLNGANILELLTSMKVLRLTVGKVRETVYYMNRLVLSCATSCGFILYE